MKTTNNKALVIAVVTSAFALLVLTKMAASVVPMIAIGTSYVAVAILVLLAAGDYRVGPKDYSAR